MPSRKTLRALLRLLRRSDGVMILIPSVANVWHMYWKIENDYQRERHEYCDLVNQSFTFTGYLETSSHAKWGERDGSITDKDDTAKELEQLQKAPKESLGPEKKERVELLAGGMSKDMPDYYNKCAKNYRMVYIGIDLGTTYSRVSVIEDGRPVVIVSDDGNLNIPSVVAYCESGILVGHSALSCDTDPSNIVYGILDINVAEIKNGEIRIIAATGDSYLGGQDIDSKIMKYVNDSSIQASNFDIIQKAKLIKRLRTVCPDPPEWCTDASVAYFKDKLYYLGGDTNRVGRHSTNNCNKGPDNCKSVPDPNQTYMGGYTHGL
ncbi:hypothetical protein WR25_22402 [Diploscapter pachys]|uniref:Uncharacterized protein n=1 Tax=Diploscapter pachys TaxID=2018661 RepID=A0A2A2JJN9_9BILA|nr:hypothetical protein WR25_22402 [Diploscapter pachys]